MPCCSKRYARKIPKHEHESHVNANSCLSQRDTLTRRPSCGNGVCQAPRESSPLPPCSKWHTIRRNSHRIRHWAGTRRASLIDQPFRDLYLFLEMRQELIRAADQIRAIQYRPDFTPVRYFDLPTDGTEAKFRTYDVSHVRSTDGIYYGGLGPEPIDLECLLYYFSKEQPVPYNSVTYSFLSDVNSVLETNRQRLQRVAVFRRLALILALSIFIIILIMFFSLILSVLTTTSNLRQMYKNDPDGGMLWQESKSSLSKTLNHKQ